MYIRELVAGYIRDYAAGLHDGRGEPLSREALLRDYAKIKAFLAAEAPEGAVAALRLGRDQRYLLCVLACMELGVPFVPLSPRWPEARVAQVRELTGFRLLIDEAALAAALDRRTTAPLALPLPRALDPLQPLYIICTSGSTGRPKAVVIPRRAYESFLRWLGGYFTALGPGSRILSLSDFVFDMSLIDLGLLLTKRCSLLLSQFRGDPLRLAHEIETWRADCLALVPGTLGLLLDDRVFGRADLSSLRCLQVGGARFSEALYREAFAKLSASTAVYQIYGTTEVTIYSHIKRLTGAAEHEISNAHVSVGKPIAGVDCALLDGEILLGGRHLMRGYFGEPEKTRLCTVERNGAAYYRTGDLGFVDGQGDYYVTGRTDETLKRRGYRVNLLDIDAYIQRLDAVRECATVAISDPAVENLLVTYVVAKLPISEERLRAEMAQFLVGFQMPDHIEFVDRLPTGDSGKVSRPELARRFLSGGSASGGSGRAG